MPRTKWNIQKCQNEAKKVGYRCLSTIYSSYKDKLEWRCKSGHTVYMNMGNFMSGKRCKQCLWDSISSSKEDVHAAIKSINASLVCFNEEYKSVKSKFTIIAICGHKRTVSLESLRAGRGCRRCYHKKQRLGIEYCKDIAYNNNGSCLSDIYIRKSDRYLWRCNKGHEWSANLISVEMGRWCKQCAKDDRLNDAHKLALEYGGRCLSTEYRSYSHRLEWECNNGHIWEAHYTYVRNDRWCSQCSVSRGQSKLYRVIQNLFPSDKFNVSQNYRGFYWLRTNPTNKARMEIDIYVKCIDNDFSLGLEYDGRQHFEAIELFGGKKRLRETKFRDAMKDNLISQNFNDIKHFIRFNYKEEITEDYVKSKLVKNGVEV